jgi:hypothetical protein
MSTRLPTGIQVVEIMPWRKDLTKIPLVPAGRHHFGAVGVLDCHTLIPRVRSRDKRKSSDWKHWDMTPRWRQSLDFFVRKSSDEIDNDGFSALELITDCTEKYNILESKKEGVVLLILGLKGEAEAGQEELNIRQPPVRRWGGGAEVNPKSGYSIMSLVSD